jgi:hypothetical protein
MLGLKSQVNSSYQQGSNQMPNATIKAWNLRSLNEEIAHVQQRLEKMENTDADYRKQVYPHVEITIEALDKKLKNLRHARILLQLELEN